jgi:hypothetical protein
MSDYWPDTPAGPLFAKPAAACTAKAERVAGFVFMGTAAEAPQERVRPDMAALTTVWRP